MIDLLWKFEKHEISVPYRNEIRTFPFYARSLWDWALEILDDPRLAPHIHYDSVFLSKFNGTSWVRFYHEPWTGDDWHDIQVSNHDLLY